MSVFEYLGLNVSLDDVDRKLTIHSCLAGRTEPKNCFELFNIEENLLLRKQCAFENDSNNLLTIYTRNWHFRLNAVQTAVN